jgi:hypothetical protein
MSENTDRIARNIQKMESGGASEEEIMSYVDMEKSQPNYGRPDKIEQTETYDWTDKEAGNFLNPILSGATFNTADEIMAPIAATFAKYMSQLSGDDVSEVTGKKYDDFSVEKAAAVEKARESIRNDQEAFATRNPGTNIALEIAGGLVTGGTGAAKALGTQAIKQAPKIIQRYVAPAIVAGVEGAIYGAGSGEGGKDRLEKAATTGLTSMILTPAIGLAVNKIAKPIIKSKAVKEFGKRVKTTLKDLHQGYKDAYRVVDKSMVRVKPEVFDEFRYKLIQKLNSTGHGPEDIGAIKPAINRLLNIKNPTVKNLQRVTIKTEALRTSGKGRPRASANIVYNGINDFLEGLKKGQVDRGKGTLIGMQKNLRKARDLYSRHQQSKALTQAEKTARLSDISNIEGDFDKAMRGRANNILNSDRKLLGHTPETVTNLEKMIVGSKGKQLARNVGKIDPGARTARGALAAGTTGTGAITGAIAGGPAGAGIGAILGAILGQIPPALGKSAKKIANKITKAEIDAIQYAILNKGDESLEQLITKLVTKYQPVTSGIAASVSASVAD